MFGPIRVAGRHGAATPTSSLWVSPVLEFLPDFHLSGAVATAVLVVILASHVALLLFFRRGRKALTKANLQLESANEELRRRAFIDPLTGLPNRMLFEDRLLHAMQRYDRDDDSRARREPRKVAVLFVDLDGFKPINDMLGHAVGDEVLKEAARRLRTTTRDSDTVARIGGDEFVLLRKMSKVDWMDEPVKVETAQGEV